MAGLNNDAQWIVLMGFLVSLALFFLGIIINQATVVGQTTAEGVIEFSKNDIQDIRNEILLSAGLSDADKNNVQKDILMLSFSRKNAIVSYSIVPKTDYSFIQIHYNNGVTVYDETTTY